MPKRNGITQFVADHLKLSNDEIVEAAAANGLNYKKQRVAHARWTITYRRKKTKLASKGGKGAHKQRAKGSRSSALQKWKPAKSVATAVVPRTAAREVKMAQMRRLIFELGYDDAREVFEVFEDAHQQMK